MVWSDFRVGGGMWRAYWNVVAACEVFERARADMSRWIVTKAVSVPPQVVSWLSSVGEEDVHRCANDV